MTTTQDFQDDDVGKKLARLGKELGTQDELSTFRKAREEAGLPSMNWADADLRIFNSNQRTVPLPDYVQLALAAKGIT